MLSNLSKRLKTRNEFSCSKICVPMLAYFCRVLFALHSLSPLMTVSIASAERYGPSLEEGHSCCLPLMRLEMFIRRGRSLSPFPTTKLK